MRIGAEGLDAVGAVLHRTAQQPGDRSRRDLVVMDVDLEPEPAPHVRADHPHAMIVDAEQGGIDLLHLKRRLVGLVDDERPVRRAIVGDRHPRLQRHRGMAAEAELVLDRRRGSGEGSVDIAGLDPVRQGQIVAERGMDDGAPGGERCGGIGHGFERIVVDRHQIGRVFRRRAAFGHHRGDRLALPVGGIERHRRLGRGFVARPVRRDRDHRCADIGKVGAGHDPEDSGLPGRLFAVDA